MLEFGTSRLGAWAWIALLVACGTVMLADGNRYLPPGREKYADRMGDGGADLLPSFDSAHALLTGQSPYHYQLPKLPRALTYEGFSYQYPPTHALVYVPLARWAGKSFRVASRAQFFATLVADVVLALAIVELLAVAVPLSADLRYALLGLFAFTLGLNPGAQLGLERGQSDIFTSAFCWWAALLFLRRHYAWAAFLACAGALLKGYGAPFAVGLLALGVLRRGSRRGTVMGSLLAGALLVAPVAKHFAEAPGAFRTRAHMYWAGWTNQGFYNLVHTIDADFLPSAHHRLIGLSGLVYALTWWRLSRVLRRGTGAERAMALVMYTCASLILILSFSRNALAYDTVLVLPGALFLAASQRRFIPWPSTRFAFARHALGLWLAVSTCLLFAMSAYRLIGIDAPPDGELPLHAVGQLGLLLVMAMFSVLPTPASAHLMR